MMLWISFALMTAAAMLAVAWPLLRRRRSGASAEQSTLAVYRDQLTEVENDRATGIIGTAEADLAKVEISRRLIAASERLPADAQAKASAPAPTRRLAAVLSCIAVALVAGALYPLLGSPSLPGEPVAARTAAAHSTAGDQSVEALFAKVEAHLEQDPNDGHGWEVIAPVYFRLGRYDDAVRARSNALRLLGATAEREADLGEALLAQANGVVTKEAKAAFDEAMQIDPTDVSARFYEGLAAEQDGNGPEAARLWRLLLADAPAGAEWIPFVRTALTRVDPAAAPPAGSPVASAATNTNATGGTQDDQVHTMVARLAARLQKDGSDPEGWIRLIRSYHVLGSKEQAATAVADARRALAGDPDKVRRFEADLQALDTQIAAAAAERPTPATPVAATTVSADAPPPAPTGPQGDQIRGMVDRLAARLHQDGSDPEGWIRLIRSYRVLEVKDQAASAVDDARRALAGDPDKLRQFEDGLRSLDGGATVAIAAAPTAPAAPAAPSVPATPAADHPAAGASDGAPAGAAAPDAHQGDQLLAMLDRLSARLHKDGSDVQGWILLIRSYRAIKEDAKAAEAVADARHALAGDADKLHAFEDALRSFDSKAAAPMTPAPAAPAASPKPDADAAGAPPPDPMVLQMVERLAARLHKDGSDVDGWVQLVRSYNVLGDKDKLRGAIDDAHNALSGDPEKRRRFDDGIKALGING